MEKFEEAITNYIEKDENFALFVDGEWGTGKTHFFEHDYLLNTLEENNEERKGRCDKNYKKEYISVYGKHSLKEIKEIIVTKILSYVDDDLISENLKQGISNIFKLFEVKFLNTENITASIDDYLESKVRDKIKVKLNKNGGRVVFIIDDIERLSDRISLKEFLGFIRNVLLDSFNCKVILVGNKKEIKGKNKKEMDNYREKVISRNLKFPNNLDVGTYILKEELKNILGNKEMEDLKNLIKFSSKSTSNDNMLNLRTLHLVITDFKHIYNQIEKNNKSDTTRMSLFTSLFILHNINRNNEIIKEKDFEELNVPNIYSFIPPKGEESKSIQQIIHEKYFEENKTANKYAFFSNELKSYIQKGFLDVSEYQRQLKDNFIDKNVEGDTLSILMYFYLYNEEKIRSEEVKAINIINKSERTFSYRLNTYMMLNILKFKGMLFISECDLEKSEKMLLNSYEPQKSNAMEGDILLNLNNFDVTWNNDLVQIKQDLTKKLKDKQSESMDSAGIYKQYIKAILKLDRKEMSKLEMDYKEVLFFDIYEKFNEYFHHIENELIENNAKITDFTSYIKNKGSQHSINEDNIYQFKQKIEEMQAKTKDKITEYNIKNLIEILDKEIDELKRD